MSIPDTGGMLSFPARYYVFDMHMRSLTVLRTLAGHQDIWC